MKIDKTDLNSVWRQNNNIKDLTFNQISFKVNQIIFNTILDNVFHLISICPKTLVDLKVWAVSEGKQLI